MHSDAAVLTADSLLRANGVRNVLLRMPAPAIAGAQGEELGLAMPEFQDMVLGAVGLRKAGSDTGLIVSATAIEGLMGTLAFDSAKELFAAAVGVVMDAAVYVVTDCVAMRADDAVYAFRLTIRAPQV